METITKRHDHLNREVLDKTPVEMPLGYEKPESLESMIARMIRTTSIQAEKAGFETAEEADDFDDDDEGEMKSEYQFTDMQEENPYAIPKPTAKAPMGNDPAQAAIAPNQAPKLAETPPVEPKNQSAVNAAQ